MIWLCGVFILLPVIGTAVVCWFWFGRPFKMGFEQALEMIDGAHEYAGMKEREAEFDRAVSELGEKYGDRVKFIYVGPLPPYDFVDMAIRL